MSIVPFSSLAEAYGHHSKYMERWLIARSACKAGLGCWALSEKAGRKEKRKKRRNHEILNGCGSGSGMN